MSFFTVVIIIWAIYQLFISLTKKSKQLPLKKFSDKFTQMQQAFNMKPYPLNNVRSIKRGYGETFEGYVMTEGSQEIKEIQEIEALDGTGSAQGVNDLRELEKKVGQELEGKTVESSQEDLPRVLKDSRASSFPLTEGDLVQGVIWSEVLGKPRALNPFKVR